MLTPLSSYMFGRVSWVSEPVGLLNDKSNFFEQSISRFRANQSNLHPLSTSRHHPLHLQIVPTNPQFEASKKMKRLVLINVSQQFRHKPDLHTHPPERP